MSSLRRGHANLLCIVPILTDDPRRESIEVCVVMVACRFGHSVTPIQQFKSLARCSSVVRCLYSVVMLFASALLCFVSLLLLVLFLVFFFSLPGPRGSPRSPRDCRRPAPLARRCLSNARYLSSTALFVFCGITCLIRPILNCMHHSSLLCLLTNTKKQRHIHSTHINKKKEHECVRQVISIRHANK